MIEGFILVVFIAAAAVITQIAWKGQNKSPRQLVIRGFGIIVIGGFVGLFWSNAIDYPASGVFSEFFILIGYLGHLLSIYTAVLASVLIRTAWAEGHTPVSEQNQNQ